MVKNTVMRPPSLATLATFTFATIAMACTVAPPAPPAAPLPPCPPPPDQTASEFCADYAKAICQIGGGACNFDVAACATFQTGQCMSNVAGAQTATRQYNQPNGKACVDALNGAYGGNPSSIDSQTLLMVDVKCNKVVVGNQASDKPCTGDNDCAGDLICAPLLGQSSSVCASITKKNSGDICGDPGDQCQGDSYCAAQTGAAPQCIATPAVGGACSQTIPCGASNRCVNGQCAARAGMGAACATNDDCTSGFCDTYPPAQCATEVSFGRGGDDCKGILGTNEPGGTDAGTAPSTEAGE